MGIVIGVSELLSIWYCRKEQRRKDKHNKRGGAISQRKRIGEERENENQKS
jgi:hypothetical protein